MNAPRALLRELPSIDRLLHHPRGLALAERFPRAYVVRRCREVLDELRHDIQHEVVTSSEALQVDAIIASAADRIRADCASTLGRVVNATGTVLHTNLGRALLPEAAIEAVRTVAASPTALEFDLERGTRGRREARIEQQLVELTGAEAATVVNNNAAAVLIALDTLARGREVVVSRGELIEIGGSFRIPDILEKSGARLREVGTTNRTHAADYERAITPETGLLLKVHTSNYRIVGFSAEVGLRDLVALGARHQVPVMEDLGSGALVDLSRWGLPREPVVADRVALGADLVSFSGDKLLGGPQAGLLVGGRRWIDAIRQNPLHRAVRCGKLTLAALEATLGLYQRSPDLDRDIPTLALLTRPLGDLEREARAVLPALSAALGPGFTVTLETSTAQIGSGALPAEEIPTKVVAITSTDLGADAIARRFRQACPPIVGRIKDDRFLLDLRTVGDARDLVPAWHGVEPPAC
jgi:L-seryl-tRNA(Ser) seleniumtransferase